MACVGHEGPAEEVDHGEEEVEGHDEEVVLHYEAVPEAEADVVALGVAALGGGDEGRVVVEGCASS